MQEWLDGDRKAGRDPERIPEIIDRLKKCWEQLPQIRLGQLISILAHSVSPGVGDPFFLDDAKIYEAMAEYLKVKK